MAIPMKSMRSPRRRRAAPRNDGRFQPMLQSKTIRRATTTRNIAVGRAPTSEEALAPVDRPRARLRTDGLSCPEPLARGLHPPAVGLGTSPSSEPLLPRAVRALARHKMRSALTTLGVTSASRPSFWSSRWQGRLGPTPRTRCRAWGTTSCGSRPAAATSTESVRGPRHEHAHGRGRRGDPSRVPLINRVSPQVDGNVQVIWGNRNWATHYRAESPEYLAIRRLRVGLASLSPRTTSSTQPPRSFSAKPSASRSSGRPTRVGEVVRILPTSFSRWLAFWRPRGSRPTGATRTTGSSSPTPPRRSASSPVS